MAEVLIGYNKSYKTYRTYRTYMKNSFRHAVSGINWAVSNHRNFKVHIGISVLVLLLAFILRVSRIEFSLLIFAIVFGLIVEMINTAIEELTDLITVKWAKQAKIAKDVAAGMMLLTAVGTALVGLIVFLPYFLKIFNF